MKLSFRSAPGAHTFLLLCTAQTEDMLAWNHSAVDQDGFQAFVAAVDHRVHNFLSNQVNLQYDVLLISFLCLGFNMTVGNECAKTLWSQSRASMGAGLLLILEIQSKSCCRKFSYKIHTSRLASGTLHLLAVGAL